MSRLLTSSNIRHCTFSRNKCNKTKKGIRHKDQIEDFDTNDLGALKLSTNSENGEEGKNLIILVKDVIPSFWKICI